MPFTLPPLQYPYNALEPFIDARTMEIHHSKHHQAYVNNLNAALAKEPAFENWSLEELLLKLDTLPPSIKGAVQNNGGGHFNHSMFWTLLKVNNGALPKGALLNAIDKAFGGFEEFKSAFSAAGATRFGSGWAWLIVNHKKELEVVSTPNQDTPLLLGKPILALDVWEHAYYLHYQNRRPDYISAFFSVVDWDHVSALYSEAVR